MAVLLAVVTLVVHLNFNHIINSSSHRIIFNNSNNSNLTMVVVAVVVDATLARTTNVAITIGRVMAPVIMVRVKLVSVVT